MSVEIKWTDTDPETGLRRYIRVHRFAGEWWFNTRSQRRGYWMPYAEPTLEMWETVLDGLQRRYRRREGVTDRDLAQVTRIVNDLRRRRAELAADEEPGSPSAPHDGG